MPPDLESKPEPRACVDCGEVQEPTWLGHADKFEPHWYVGLNSHGRCPQCQSLFEIRQEQAEKRTRFLRKLREEMGIDIGTYADMRMDTYNPENESQHKAKQVAEEFLEDMVGKPCFIPGVWFWSSKNGIGKTHLSVAIMHEAIERGWSAFIAVEPALVRDMRAGFALGKGNGNPELEELAAESKRLAERTIQRAIAVDILVLDDLGRAHIASSGGLEWLRNEVLFPILDARHHQQKTTIVTSNFSPSSIRARIGGAAADRLLGLCPIHIEMDGESKRYDYTRGGM